MSAKILDKNRIDILPAQPAKPTSKSGNRNGCQLQVFTCFSQDRKSSFDVFHSAWISPMLLCRKTKKMLQWLINRGRCHDENIANPKAVISARGFIEPCCVRVLLCPGKRETSTRYAHRIDRYYDPVRCIRYEILIGNDIDHVCLHVLVTGENNTPALLTSGNAGKAGILFKRYREPVGLPVQMSRLFFGRGNKRSCNGKQIVVGEVCSLFYNTTSHIVDQIDELMAFSSGINDFVQRVSQGASCTSG